MAALYSIFNVARNVPGPMFMLQGNSSFGKMSPSELSDIFGKFIKQNNWATSDMIVVMSPLGQPAAVYEGGTIKVDDVVRVQGSAKAGDRAGSALAGDRAAASSVAVQGDGPARRFKKGGRFNKNRHHKHTNEAKNNEDAASAEGEYRPRPVAASPAVRAAGPPPKAPKPPKLGKLVEPRPISRETVMTNPIDHLLGMEETASAMSRAFAAEMAAFQKTKVDQMRKELAEAIEKETDTAAKQRLSEVPVERYVAAYLNLSLEQAKAERISLTSEATTQRMASAMRNLIEAVATDPATLAEQQRKRNDDYKAAVNQYQLAKKIHDDARAANEALREFENSRRAALESERAAAQARTAAAAPVVPTPPTTTVIAPAPVSTVGPTPASLSTGSFLAAGTGAPPGSLISPPAAPGWGDVAATGGQWGGQ